MNSIPIADKTGKALDAQRFQMLKDIADELSSELIFPTHFDLTMRLRTALKDPGVSVRQIQSILSVEPLVSSKVVAVANSVAYGGGSLVRDLSSAIQRLGLETVRTIAFGVAMKQLLLSRNVAGFAEITQRLCEHSFFSAAACMVLARNLSRVNPDEAMLAGLVHDLGACYMLYRAAHYEELRARPDTVKHIVHQWHESIGESLLHALGLPSEIVDAIHDHDQPRPAPTAPLKLPDIVYVGNLIAGGSVEWLYKDVDAAELQRAELGEPYVSLFDEIKSAGEEFRTIFA